MRTVVYARALIIEGSQMLVDERVNGRKLFGGKVKRKETSAAAVERELEEELGVQAKVEGLAFTTERVSKAKKGRGPKRVLEIVYHVKLSGTIAPVGKHWPRWVNVSDDVRRACGEQVPAN